MHPERIKMAIGGGNISRNFLQGGWSYMQIYGEDNGVTNVNF